MSALVLTLQLLCPHAPEYAEPIAREAHRFLIHPVLVASVIARESGCRMDRVGAHGELGAGQIIPGGAAATSKILGKRFTRKQLKNLDINIYVTARYIAWNMAVCKDNPRLALTGYSHRTTCHPSLYARKVLRTVGRARKYIAEQQRPSPFTFPLTNGH
jgi:soluble lytic murein transglycosylase-like protein